MLQWINNIFKKADLIIDDEIDGEEVSNREKDIIKNVLTYKNLVVEDLMVPRSDIVGVASDLPFNEIKDLFITSQHSRFPIYVDSLDKIIGFLHVKDMVKYWGLKEFDVSQIIRPVIFVSSQMKAMDLLAKMKKFGIYLAIAVDEYGGTDGLLTMQDLVESIIGEIEEEYKSFDQENDYITLGDGSVNANARMTLENIEKLFNVKLDNSYDCDTLAGIILSCLGRMPELNEIVEHESGLVFKVISVNPRRILRVLIDFKRSKET